MDLAPELNVKEPDTTNTNVNDTDNSEPNNVNQEINNNNNNDNTINNNNLNDNNNNNNNITSDNTIESINTQSKPNEQVNQNSNKVIKRKTVNKRNMTEIQMLDVNDKFSITEEAKNLFPHINLAQLLSISPALRKELELGCKPKTERIVCSFTFPNIPIIIGEIEGKYLRILYDTGANVNVITTNGLNKLSNQNIVEKSEEQTITIANGTSVSTKLSTTLMINVNNYCTFKEDFYIIDYVNPYFDVIFGRGIQKKYRLFIDPDDDCIYQKNKKGAKMITEIIPNNEINDVSLVNTVVVSNYKHYPKPKKKKWSINPIVITEEEKKDFSPQFKIY